MIEPKTIFSPSSPVNSGSNPQSQRTTDPSVWGQGQIGDESFVDFIKTKIDTPNHINIEIITFSTILNLLFNFTFY